VDHQTIISSSLLDSWWNLTLRESTQESESLLFVFSFTRSGRDKLSNANTFLLRNRKER
jgi:hypothetical protein